MKLQSKICDAVDWFDPEVVSVVRNKLSAEPALHRKQWEFAMIYLMLEKMGHLHPDQYGLSMGGGREILLYAIAREVQKLVVTDLYDDTTGWSCARTGDPDQFIKDNMPFPVDDDKLEALRMDMRNLDFDDKTFDFAYSACSFEHIGEQQDFASHLEETHRVLKDDGHYIFTTEFVLGNQTIPSKGNYLFCAEHLSRLIDEAGFVVIGGVDCSTFDTPLNNPLPPVMDSIMDFGKTSIANPMSKQHAHVRLLRGQCPFTSIMLILTKKTESLKSKTVFTGLNESIVAANKGVNKHRNILKEFTLSLNPYSFKGQSIFADHADFFDKILDPNQDNRVFHSDYIWLGEGEKNIIIELPTSRQQADPLIRLKVFKMPATQIGNAVTVYDDTYGLQEGTKCISYFLDAEEDFRYAVSATMVRGACDFGDISIIVRPGACSTPSSRTI